MTLNEWRKKDPGLFHPNQDWFEGEPFMDVSHSDINSWTNPQRSLVFRQASGPDGAGELFSAAQLFSVYRVSPYRVLWQNYLWTSDLDSHGQRIYVGDNGKGFEIHRHIHISARFGYPVWH